LDRAWSRDGWSRVSIGRGARLVLVGSCSATVVLGGHERGFLADSVAKYGLDVLVPALVGFPVVVSEGLVNGMDVELIDELLMSISVWSGGGHGILGLEYLLEVWRCVGMEDVCGWRALANGA
jgi:hypothetical protein